MSNLYREPSIDASYHVSDNLAKQFQRRRFLEINQSETRIACGGHVCYCSHDELLSFKVQPFLAHLAKDNVSLNCHHLASVVR
jgi:hypothetical protein